MGMGEQDRSDIFERTADLPEALGDCTLLARDQCVYKSHTLVTIDNLGITPAPTAYSIHTVDKEFHPHVTA